MPDSPSELTESLAVLSQFFVGDGTLSDTVQRVVELASQAVPKADMAGVTVLVDGRVKTAFFTDPDSPEIDQAQYETGVGPCLDAFRHMEVCHVEDTDADTKWAAFSEAAGARGVRSTMSLPLVVNHEGVGALNFYAREPKAFGEDAEVIGTQFATQAAVVLANAQAYWDAKELGTHLTEALKSRATIEQAKGILMRAEHCGPDEAFEILVRASQRENRKLREVAAQLVENTQRREDEL